MVDVSRVEIGARLDEQIYNSFRPREVERRLAIATTLVSSARLPRQHRREQIGTVEMCGGARIGNSAGREEPLGHRARRRVQWMEATGPPVALSIRIGTEREHRVHEIYVPTTRNGSERWRVEAERRAVYYVAERVTMRHETTQLVDVAILHRALEPILRR